MYTWIWRTIPGGWPIKLLGCLALLVGVVLLLMTVIFPWVGPKLPFNHVTIDRPTPTSVATPSGGGG